MHRRRRTLLTSNARFSDQDTPHQEADRILQELRAAVSVNLSYARLNSCVMSGFLFNWYELHNSLLLYWKLRDHLYADGELVLYGKRIVVPAVLRRRTLARLHDSHRGVEATRSWARQTVF